MSELILQLTQRLEQYHERLDFSERMLPHGRWKEPGSVEQSRVAGTV